MRKSIAALAILTSITIALAPAASALGQSTRPAGGQTQTPAQVDNPDQGDPGPGPDQTTGPNVDPNRKPPGDGGGGGLFNQGNMFLFIILGVFVLMMVFSSRSRKKQENKRKEMLGGLKKGDKIITIGGVLGTVMEARDNEIVVKVDEQNNIRMRFSKWAVRAVGEGIASAEPEEKR